MTINNGVVNSNYDSQLSKTAWDDDDDDVVIDSDNENQVVANNSDVVVNITNITNIYKDDDSDENHEVQVNKNSEIVKSDNDNSNEKGLTIYDKKKTKKTSKGVKSILSVMGI